MKSAEYDRMFRLEDRYWWFVSRRRLVDALMKSVYWRRSSRSRDLAILDVGCGTGAMSSMLKAHGRVVSADFSPLALAYSRRRGLTYLVGADAMRMPFASDSFDAIVAMDVLEHLPDDRAAMCEFYRVLRSGGRVFATVPAYRHLWSEHDVALMHFRRYARRELRDRFQASGFQLDKLSHAMTLLYPAAAAQRRLNARRPPHDPPQAALPAVPRPVNAALCAFLALENAFASRLNLPFGMTIVCVARKPTQA